MSKITIFAIATLLVPFITVAGEFDFPLVDGSWQYDFMDSIPAFQVDNKSDDNKFKFKVGQRVGDTMEVTQQKWIPRPVGWKVGDNPFTDKNGDGESNILDEYPDFDISKTEGLYHEWQPADDTSIWAGGYKEHPPEPNVGVLFLLSYYTLGVARHEPPSPIIYSPDNPHPDATAEAPYSFTESSWQRLYPVSTTYAQVEIKDDGAKIKFALINSGGDNGYGYAQWFNLKRGIPVKVDWQLGEEPFNIAATFPEYNFSGCFEPVSDRDVWTCTVQIPGYN